MLFFLVYFALSGFFFSFFFCCFGFQHDMLDHSKIQRKACWTRGNGFREGVCLIVPWKIDNESTQEKGCLLASTLFLFWSVDMPNLPINCRLVQVPVLVFLKFFFLTIFALRTKWTKNRKIWFWSFTIDICLHMTSFAFVWFNI